MDEKSELEPELVKQCFEQGTHVFGFTPAYA
jgi:hypothetical protein